MLFLFRRGWRFLTWLTARESLGGPTSEPLPPMRRGFWTWLVSRETLPRLEQPADGYDRPRFLRYLLARESLPKPLKGSAGVHGPATAQASEEDRSSGPHT